MFDKVAEKKLDPAIFPNNQNSKDKEVLIFVNTQFCFNPEISPPL